MFGHTKTESVARLGLCLMAAIAQMAACLPASAAQKPIKSNSNVLVAEGKSKAICEAVDGRIFVDTRWGRECIAYYVTKGFETQRRAVIFFDGDISLENYSDPAKMAKNLDATHEYMQSWSNKLKVRYISISRVGVNGSSGNHGERGKPKELMIMNAATDALKQKLGLDTIALAGQSRGSTIAASMLSLGRNDVSCAVLGSGALELVELESALLKEKGLSVSKAKMYDAMFDPASHVDSIAPNSNRRIFVMGDEADARTPFAQQQRYAAKLQAYGHHAKLIRVDAGDAGSATDHAATLFVLPTAGGCLKGTSDEQLVKANDNLGRRKASAEITRLAPPVSGSAALMIGALRSGPTALSSAK